MIFLPLNDQNVLPSILSLGWKIMITDILGQSWTFSRLQIWNLVQVSSSETPRISKIVWVWVLRVTHSLHHTSAISKYPFPKELPLGL